MVSMLLLVLFGLGMLLLPRLLPAVVTVIRRRVAETIQCLDGLAWQAFRCSGRLVTKAGMLSPTDALAQVVGASVLTAAGILFAGTDVVVTLATLAPLFGTDFTAPQGLLGTFDTLMGLSLVLLAVVFGLMLTDLLSWTGLTRFALITRARAGAFCLALLCLGLSALVVATLAVYRVQTLFEPGGTDGPNVLWMQHLPAVILVLLPLLLFIGVAVALTSLDTFFEAVTAGLAAVWGIVVATLSLLLRGLDVLLETLVEGTTAVPEGLKTLQTAGQTRMSRVTQGFATAGGGLKTKLSALVQPRTFQSATRTAPASEGAALVRPTPLATGVDGQHGPEPGGAA